MDEDREIREFKEQCLDYLDNVLKEIKAFGENTYILDDEHLAALNVRQAEPLDVDEKAIDFGHRFFSPRFSLEQTRQITTDFLADIGEEMISGCEWRKRCRRGSYVGIFDPDGLTYDPEERHPLCDPETCATRRLNWMLTAMGADYGNRGVWEGSDWYYLNAYDLVPGLESSLPAHDVWDARVPGNPPRCYTFHVNRALLLHGAPADKPHIGATVLDSTEPGDARVLRSEVAAAIGLLKHQFRRGDFRKHHTLPALVFSFQHDRFGRITQFHFDGRCLSMRQSRILDLWSHEPTTDAYHMIRWLANRPIGDTEYGTAAEEDRLEFQDGHETSNGSLPVEVRGT